MKKAVFDSNYLRENLPHRYPFLLIDKVIEFIPHKLLVAIKNVTCDEWFFQGHFPENPIYPGVLLIESIAQASIILFQESYIEESKTMEKNRWVLVGIKSRFIRPVLPGDQVRFECVPIKMLSNGSIFLEATAFVEGEKVLSATLTVGRSKKV